MGLIQGDQVQVRLDNGDGWLTGFSLSSKMTGIFPAEYVEEIPAAAAPKLRPTEIASAEPLPTHKALFAFEGAEDGDLTVEEGDLLRIELDNDDGWLTCYSLRTRAIGIVPTDYVERLPGTPQKEEAKASAGPEDPSSTLFRADDKTAAYVLSTTSGTAGNPIVSKAVPGFDVQAVGIAAAKSALKPLRSTATPTGVVNAVSSVSEIHAGMVLVKLHYRDTRRMRVSRFSTVKNLLTRAMAKFKSAEPVALWCRGGSGAEMVPLADGKVGEAAPDGQLEVWCLPEGIVP